jgi:hypothetical protein
VLFGGHVRLSRENRAEQVALAARLLGGTILDLHASDEAPYGSWMVVQRWTRARDVNPYEPIDPVHDAGHAYLAWHSQKHNERWVVQSSVRLGLRNRNDHWAPTPGADYRVAVLP